MLRAVHPDFGAIYLLPRMIGLAKASDLLLSGRTVDASEADRIGMVSRVVPEDQLESATKELAKSMAKNSPLIMSMTKASINQAANMDLPAALEREAMVQSIAFTTEDFQESMAAFMEKREPNFKGK